MTDMKRNFAEYRIMYLHTLHMYIDPLCPFGEFFKVPPCNLSTRNSLVLFLLFCAEKKRKEKKRGFLENPSEKGVREGRWA